MTSIEAQITTLEAINIQRIECCKKLTELNKKTVKILKEMEPIPENFVIMFDHFENTLQDGFLEIQEADDNVGIHTNSSNPLEEEELLIKILSCIYEGLEYAGDDGSSNGRIYFYIFKRRIVPLPHGVRIL